MEIFKVTQTGAEVQSALNGAETAYQKPTEGIPSTDMTAAVQQSLAAADSAYQKPEDGIPKTAMDIEVRGILQKAELGQIDYVDAEVTYNDETGKWEFAENPYVKCLWNWNLKGVSTVLNLKHSEIPIVTQSLGRVLMFVYNPTGQANKFVISGSICTDEDTMVIVKLTAEESYVVVKTLQ